MRAFLRELLWRLSVCSGTMKRSVGARRVMTTCRVRSAPVAMGGMRLAQLSTVTQGAAARRIGVTCESANRRHVAGLVTIGMPVLLALIALSPSAAFAANNPHTAVTTDGTNCAQCHAPHQAAIGNGILKGVGDTGDDYTPVAFCYGCHDGNPAVNVKTGMNNASFEGLSGHSVEAVETGDGDLTNVCSDCHYPHADSATRFRLAETTITITLADDSTVDRAVTGADNSWCLACHDDQNSWYRSLCQGAYPALDAPTRTASGYPTSGTFPGATVYTTPAKNAHANIPAGSMDDWVMASREATRVAGDCLWCHSGHRGKSEYDGLVDTFGASGASAADLVEGDYAAVCFRCHSAELAVGVQFYGPYTVPDVASSALATDTTASRSNGHRIRSEGSTLPQNAPLPCYECHNPHGSERGNSRLISDVLGAELDVSTDAGMRAFCLTCHSTSDADGLGRPYKWDSVTKTYVALTGSEAPVVGLDRATDLRLSPTFGHASGQTGVNCLTECHYDVHNPVVPTAATSCFSGGCHSALHGMVDETEYTLDETSDPDLLGMPAYHHVLNGPEPDRGPGEERDYPVFDADNQELYCISCHVGHSEWTELGVAYNLRTSGTSASPQPSNTDEGLCLSCHSYTMPFRIYRSIDGVTPTPAGQADNVLPATAVMRVEDDLWGYEPDPNDPSGNLVPPADRSPHNYTVSTYFEKGNSEFKGNCSKCHGVLTPGQYGEAQPFAFTVHFSPEQRLLNALGQDRNTMTIEADGQTAAINEEDMCFRCHSNSTEKGGLTLQGTLPYPYTEYDYYGEVRMGEASRRIGEQMDGNPFGHKPASYYMEHRISSIDEPQEYLGTVVAGQAANKHIECADCHNHHVVGDSRHVYGTDNRVSDAIKGVRGVGFKTTSTVLQKLATVNWPTADPISYGSGTNDELEYKQMATYEYEICFKCHSSANADSAGSVALPAWGGKMTWTVWPGQTQGQNLGVNNWTNVAQDFNVGNNSRHPVLATLSGYYYPTAEATSMVLWPGYPATDTSAGRTSSLDPGQLSNGWGPNDTMMCSDCHGDSSAPFAMIQDPPGSGNWVPNPDAESVPQGPHGSSIRFSLRGPGTDWPVKKSTGAPIVLADLADSTYAPSIFCSNCHPASAIRTNRAHSAGGTNHPPLACVSCHVVVPHGSKMSRLLGDHETMDPRFAYQGNKNNVLISSFQKTTGAYAATNCSVVDGSACDKGQHRSVTGNQTGPGWENW